MKILACVVVCSAVLVAGCSSDPSTTPATGDAGTLGKPDAASVPQDSGASTNGTVHVTWNLDGAGDKTFDCVADKAMFVDHSTDANGINVDCNNGVAEPEGFIAIGLTALHKTGMTDESAGGTVVTFQKYTLELISSYALSGKAATPPQHTINVTTYDAATHHIVGVATENIDGKGGQGSANDNHTLVMKIEFDVTCTVKP